MIRVALLERENARLRSQLERLRARRGRGFARLARLPVLMLLTVGIVASAGPPQEQTWKGMILARPALSRLSLEQMRLGLVQYNTVSVLIEDLPEDIKDSITRDDLDQWVTNRLRNAGVSVVSLDQQFRGFYLANKSSDEEMLRSSDAVGSTVYVNVNAMIAGRIMVCNVEIECQRGVFVYPGYFTSAQVWDRSLLMTFGSGLDAKAKVREALNQLLDLFEEDWKKCNPRGS